MLTRNTSGPVTSNIHTALQTAALTVTKRKSIQSSFSHGEFQYRQRCPESYTSINVSARITLREKLLGYLDCRSDNCCTNNVQDCSLYQPRETIFNTISYCYKQNGTFKTLDVHEHIFTTDVNTTVKYLFCWKSYLNFVAGQSVPCAVPFHIPLGLSNRLLRWKPRKLYRSKHH